MLPGTVLSFLNKEPTSNKWKFINFPVGNTGLSNKSVFFFFLMRYVTSKTVKIRILGKNFKI